MSVKTKLGRKAATSVVKHTAHGTVSKARREPMRASKLVGLGAVLGALAGFLAGRSAGQKAAAPAPSTTPTPSPTPTPPPASPEDEKLQPDPGLSATPAAPEAHADPDAD